MENRDINMSSVMIWTIIIITLLLLLIVVPKYHCITEMKSISHVESVMSVYIIY